MMTMDVSKGEAAKTNSGQGPQECAGCCKTITERYLLKALDLYWHEDCLKCGCCDCRLGEVGSTLYTKANLILCKRDYLRLFGNTGYCAACSKVIPAFEMVMRARSNVYHLECFACQQCNHRFCVGDRFYLCENKILCEYDYEERLVFANMAYNPPPLSHLKRQTSIPPVSRGPTDKTSRPLCTVLNRSGPGAVPCASPALADLTIAQLITWPHRFQPNLPNHLINGHRAPLPPTNGDLNNNMSGSGGQPPPNSMANQPFQTAGHLKNSPMSLGATS
jgi:hypothetical protein